MNINLYNKIMIVYINNNIILNKIMINNINLYKIIRITNMIINLVNKAIQNHKINIKMIHIHNNINKII